jgi:D-3-phosphoglycerate dehydrogenase
MRIVIPDDFPPVYQGHTELEALEPYGEVVLHDTRAADAQELIDRLRGADALINIRAYSKFDRALFEALPELKTIAILGTGTDNVDLAAATEHGVVVSNTPGASTVSVAEMAFTLMLAAAKHLPTADRAIRAGEWKHIMGTEIKGKTLGIVGLGAIGQEMASMGRAFGMRVLAWSLTRDPARAERVGATWVELDELLASSDVVSLHLRASDQTSGMIGRRELGMMKPTAILVNTCRAAVVDEGALYEALRDRKIRGAGIDVFTKEPPGADNPLLTLDNVVLTPHYGGGTEDAEMEGILHAFSNIRKVSRGEPLDPADVAPAPK